MQIRGAPCNEPSRNQERSCSEAIMPRRNLRLQAAIRTIHLWVGLAAGILFCLMSLSGSLIVFRGGIESRLRPRWMPRSGARPALVLTEASRNIGRQWPGASIESLNFPVRTGEPYEFVIRGADRHQVRVFTDCRSGEVLGTFELAWLDWIVDLHHNLRLGAAGKQVVGAIGLGLFAASLTGLALWLMRKPNWKTALLIQRKGSWKRLHFDMHRSAGLLSNVVLLIISTTGISMAYPETIQRILGVAPAKRGRRVKTIASAGAESRSIEDLVAAARHAIPGSEIRQVRFADMAGRATTVRLWAPGDLRREGSSLVSLEPATARILQMDRASQWTWTKRLLLSATPVHYAEWGGALIKILWCLTGFMPPLLLVSGFFVWWHPSRFRSRTTRPSRQDARQPERVGQCSG